MDNQEFVKMVCDNAKTKQWISCTVPVTRNDGKPEQKTIKAMSAGLSDLLDSMIERA